jgi:hypothetical protein
MPLVTVVYKRMTGWQNGREMVTFGPGSFMAKKRKPLLMSRNERWDGRLMT